MKVMDVKGALTKLDYYHRRLRFENNLYTWGLKKKWINRIMNAYHYDKRYIFQGISIFMHLLIFTGFWIGGIFVGYLQLPLFTGIFFLLITLMTFVNQKTLRHKDSLKNDHFYKCLGKNRTEYLRHLVTNQIRNQMLEWLIPFSLIPVIYFSYLYQNIWIIVLYIVLLGIIYQIQVISAIFCNYYSRYYKHQVILESLFILAFNILLASGIAFILGLLILIHFVILPFKMSDLTSVNLLLYISSLIHLVILYCILSFVIHKWVHPFVDNHYAKITQMESYVYRKNQNKTTMNTPNLITRLFCFKMNEVEQVIIKKDLKMLVRGHKLPLLLYLGYSIASIPLGIGLIATIKVNPLDLHPAVTNGLMLVGWLLSLICYFFYQFKHLTWMSSEGFHLRIYYMTKVNYRSVFKAKKRMNLILALPAISGFIITSFWVILFASLGQILLWLFVVSYLILMVNILFDTVLWLDVSKPPLHPEFKMNWIGDSSNMIFIGAFLVLLLPLLMGELMRQIFITNTLLFVLLGILTGVMFIWKWSINKQIKQLEKAKLVSYGGIIYDQV
jgi:hypothetical protein